MKVSSWGPGMVGAVAAPVLCLVLLYFWLRGGEPESMEPPAVKRDPVSKPEMFRPDPVVGLEKDLSAQYLKGYGAATKTPLEDLVLVADVLEGFRNMVKVPDALPTGSNKDVVHALLGNNPYKIRFLEPSSGFLNEAGEIVDRWGTPVFFHFVEVSDVGLRSAGPDRVMWTEDDVVMEEVRVE